MSSNFQIHKNVWIYTLLYFYTDPARQHSKTLHMDKLLGDKNKPAIYMNSNKTK